MLAYQVYFAPLIAHRFALADLQRVQILALIFRSHRSGFGFHLLPSRFAHYFVALAQIVRYWVVGFDRLVAGFLDFEIHHHFVLAGFAVLVDSTAAQLRLGYLRLD